MSDPISLGANLLSPGRRQLLLAPVLAALPLGLSARQAEAINPAETQVTLPDQIKWTAWTAGPAAQCRNGDAPWRARQARGIRRANEVVPGLYECTPQL